MSESTSTSTRQAQAPLLRHSTLDTRHSTLDARRSTLDTRRSTLDTHSTLDTRPSSFIHLHLHPSRPRPRPRPQAHIARVPRAQGRGMDWIICIHTSPLLPGPFSASLLAGAGAQIERTSTSLREDASVKGGEERIKNQEKPKRKRTAPHPADAPHALLRGTGPDGLEGASNKHASRSGRASLGVGPGPGKMRARVRRDGERVRREMGFRKEREWARKPKTHLHHLRSYCSPSRATPKVALRDRRAQSAGLAPSAVCSDYMHAQPQPGTRRIRPLAQRASVVGWEMPEARWARWQDAWASAVLDRGTRRAERAERAERAGRAGERGADADADKRRGEEGKRRTRAGVRRSKGRKAERTSTAGTDMGGAGSGMAGVRGGGGGGGRAGPSCYNASASRANGWVRGNGDGRWGGYKGREGVESKESRGRATYAEFLRTFSETLRRKGGERTSESRRTYTSWGSRIPRLSLPCCAGATHDDGGDLCKEPDAEQEGWEGEGDKIENHRSARAQED
ncbi:hypothetical protein B0H13DRAFT_1933113 [Mycena leptocephala]|nr:hypothetical protein B0H13DRAFT_1933113 [Mycena leptocephala]